MSQVWTINQALEKASAYCAVQERCMEEVRAKLYSWKLTGVEIEQVITELILQGFLNEERYTKAFVRGKFRQKQWGRRKIIFELKKKKISQVCINIGLQEINDEEYLDVLQQLIEKKSREIKDTNPFLRKKKLINYLQGKGYEYEIISSYLND